MLNAYHFISGLPRTGSSLLSAVLSQNPSVHAGGNSALCQLMWDMQKSCRESAHQQLTATSKFDLVQKRLCASLPDLYYSDVKDKHVFDKCRSWTIPDNMDMLCDYITETPKVVVLVRPIEDIVASFAKLNKDNGIEVTDYDCMLSDWSEPIMRSYNGAMFAKQVNSGEFLFVDYDTMIGDMQRTIDRIYNFVGLESYTHDLGNIKVLAPENDSVYGLIGMHDVRSVVKKRTVDVKLPADVLKRCQALTKELYDNLDFGVLEKKAA